jgi:hypothetical protein
MTYTPEATFIGGKVQDGGKIFTKKKERNLKEI